ncbi:MAG TPA: DNA-binding domain-containing protein [Opitutaceae bacterium]|nr:DNA-binding domain-containing protein [Opitutaceae bacterium]
MPRRAPQLPEGLKPPPRRAPVRLRSTDDLRALQRFMAHALVRPLTPADRLQRRWIDGRPMAEVAGEFIKPGRQLSSFERLELYNRMYWFRVIDCVYDDNPGLRALLGERRFSRLVRAYLARHPSRSFTLRNLCARLARFIREEPHWTAPHTAPAWALARFEWARTVAFDGESRPVPAAAELARTPPGRLRLGLQPYLSLLALDYPVDDYVIAVKERDALRGEASNAVDHGPRRAAAKKIPRLRRGRIHVAVHRHRNRLYYKRLEPAAFRLLTALGAGQPVARAVAAAGRGVTSEQVQEWFGTWMGLGWFWRRGA